MPTQIQKSEVKTWEDKFKQQVYPSVQFFREPLSEENPEPQIASDDEVSMKMYDGENGINVDWQGKILLQNRDFVYWEFSLSKDPVIKVESVLNADTVDLIKRLFNYYTDWSTYWMGSLSGANTASLSEIKKNRTAKFIRENFSERMRILSGLRK